MDAWEQNNNAHNMLMNLFHKIRAELCELRKNPNPSNNFYLLCQLRAMSQNLAMLWKYYCDVIFDNCRHREWIMTDIFMDYTSILGEVNHRIEAMEEDTKLQRLEDRERILEENRLKKLEQQRMYEENRLGQLEGAARTYEDGSRLKQLDGPARMYEDGSRLKQLDGPARMYESSMSKQMDGPARMYGDSRLKQVEGSRMYGYDKEL